MQMLFASALTPVVLVSLAMIAAAQRTPIPSASKVAAPSADAPKIDPSRVKFLLLSGCSGKISAEPAFVHGIVASGTDLSEDLTARQMIKMGITFGQEQCPSTTKFYVYLRPGDPASFTDAGKGFEFSRGDRSGYPADVVGGGWIKDSSAWIIGYQNFPRALKDQQLTDAAQARQRDAVLARSAAFAKANGVAHFVTIQQLTANPFVYQGQVVAIYGEFQQMNSATQALFSSGDRPSFVVSSIPAARFTQQRTMVILAGRVLGNIEIKLGLGATLVPHLSFVGNAFCQQQFCSEYALNLK